MQFHLRHLTKPIVFLIHLFLTVGTLSAAEIMVKHNNVNNSARDNWPVDLLKHALQYDSNNSYRIEAIGEQVNQERLRQLVREGVLSVMWVGTSAEAEQEFRPVRIPVFKGLLGHRIFIIKQGTQARFSQVNTFSDLLKLQAGQGRFWSDTPILEAAGIPVVKPAKYLSLFHMLEGERFDYFPRAVHEPWSEVLQHAPLNLVVETDLMLVYPMPLYFFTAKDNEQLARAIYSGLRKSIDDGSFDQMFLTNEDIKKALELTKVGSRKVFRIPNPGLSQLTPLNDSKLWLDIANL